MEQNKNNDMLLEVKDLRTYFHMPNGVVIKAVEGVNFTLKKGKVLGIIGESGSGKSVTSRAIMQIVDKPGRVESGEVIFKGEDLLKKSDREMSHIRGQQISLIFQDPNTSFNPYMTIGAQLRQAYRVHKKKATKQECEDAVRDALKLVGINNWEEVCKCYPCQFSAGFRQRIFIGMAMIFKPDLLIADEPTTSLGITIQAEIIQALNDIKEKVGNSVIIITHDFGVVSQFADDIFVMYAGRCVEYAPKRDLLVAPRHPYTVGLLRSVPLLEARKTKRLKSIPGFPPDMANPPKGCPFAVRCEHAQPKCFEEQPELVHISEDRLVACHYPLMDYETSQDTQLD
ncbi:MAG: ABC transporter ATP-binding protein [Oscillospiraceae bacterium]|nr:ABC transporter ATP-binding protein [Oscillospiraceae bacterium]